MDKYRGIIAENSLCLIQGIQGWLSGSDLISSIAIASDWQDLLKLSGTGSAIILITTGLWITKSIDIPSFKAYLLKTEARVLCFMDKRLTSNITELYNCGIHCLIGMDDSQEEFLWGIKEIANDKRYITSELLSVFITLHSTSLKNGSHNIYLTKREEEILRYIRDGFTNQQIADTLFLSKRTVDGYRETILNKFGARNTAHLISIIMKDRNLQDH